MKDLRVWQFILECLEQNQPVALLAVLHSKGSSPGRQGFKMALEVSGKMCGSIGGGIMEHKLVELSRNLLATTPNSKPTLKRQIHSKATAQNQSGMICSGEQTVAIYFLQQKNLPVISSIIHAAEKKQPEVLVLSEAGIAFEPDRNQQDIFTFLRENDTVWQYSERFPMRDSVYIVGGGHVALALSKVLTMLGFELHLFDDRSGLNTFEENQYVHYKTIVPYPEIAGFIPENENSFVVIMTFGYRIDAIVLKQLLGRKFRYLGLMGSQAKIDQMFGELRNEGFTEEDLKNVHAPIGIQIKSQTPEEIAISIAAQIIQVKNG